MSDRVFIIDLARCTGCGACLIACKDRAGMPDHVDLLRIETTESGAFPTPEVAHRVVHCFHCAHAPCVEACPERALAHTEDGLVALDRDACVGCGQCAEACPFAAIEALPDGAAAKCDGCGDEASQGREPTCVRACPMRALGYAPTPASLPVGRMRAPDDGGSESGARVLYLARLRERDS